MDYQTAVKALKTMEKENTRWTKIKNLVITRKDCMEAINKNNNKSPESYIEQARRDA